MSLKKLKENLNAALETAEKANQFVKKRSATVSELKNQLQKLSEEHNELAKRHDSHCHLMSEFTSEFRKELELLANYKESLADKFFDLQNALSPKYDYYKKKLNDHFYVLQRAFNDYVRSASGMDNNYKRLDAIVTDIQRRVDALDEKMVKLFFNGDNMK